jgi:hypothetical protein
MKPGTLKAMSAPDPAREKQFDWPVCYEAEEFLLRSIDDFLVRNTFARQLAQRMRDETGTLLLDWIDYVGLPIRSEEALRKIGFVADPLAQTCDGAVALYHPVGMLPRILLVASDADLPLALAIHVESLMDFMAAHGLSAEPEGDVWSRFRRVVVSVEKGARFEAVERRGSRSFISGKAEAGQVEALLKSRELWQTRARLLPSAEEGYRHTHALLDRILNLVEPDLACHLVFEGERTYWQRRNRAAQVQKQRQDVLGLGWANHDHHTFRSSRAHFLDLMQAMEKLGFERRERYYAGAQAGWGAQILEQPVEGIVVFCRSGFVAGGG